MVTLDQARAIKARNEAFLFSFPDVHSTMTTIYNGEPIILILTDQVPEGVPDTIEGVPIYFMISGRIVSHVVTSLMEPMIELPPLDGTFRPLVGGCSICPMSSNGGGMWYGTLGNIIHNVMINGVPKSCILSNAHVLDGGEYNRVIIQPASGSEADRVATYVSGNHPLTSIDKTADWAIAVLDSEGLGSDNTIDQAVSSMTTMGNSQSVPAIGEYLFKTGWRTGFTGGYVLATDFSSLIGYDDSTPTFCTDLISVAPRDPFWLFLAPGDSGSVAYRKSDGKMMGLVFAGSSGGEMGIICKTKNIIASSDPSLGLANATYAIHTDAGQTYTFLLVEVVPSDSNISVKKDGVGNDIPITNKKIESVQPGTYVITLSKTGFETYSTTVTLAEGDSKVISRELYPVGASTYLTINASPEQSIITMYSGTVTLQNHVPYKLPAGGNYLVTVKCSGFKDWSEIIDVADGQTTEQTVELVTDVPGPTNEINWEKLLLYGGIGVGAITVVAIATRR